MKERIKAIEEIIRNAAVIMMEGAKKIQDANIKTKGDANNFVTEYDVAVQKYLQEKLYGVEENEG